MRRSLIVLAVIGAALAPAAYSTEQASPTLDHIHMLIPGGAGGGWDRTARNVGKVLTDTGLVENIRYENMSGGGGGKAIAHLIELNNANMLMVNSTPIVVRALRGVFPQSFRDLKPIASVIGDYSTVVVRTQSDIDTLQTLGSLQQANPRAVAIAGGSVPGGTDHIFAALLVKSLGGMPQTTKYIPYDAGGKAMAGLLSGEVQALSSGYGEVVDMVQQGWIRLLCIGAPRRLSEAPDTPTCEEAGAPGATFVNWRGFFASPATDEARAQAYRQALAQMYGTAAWEQTRMRNGWVNIYRPGDDFITMLENQEQTIGQLMRELGLM